MGLLARLKENAGALGAGHSALYAIDRAFIRLGLPLGVTLDYLVAQAIRAAPMLPPRRGAAIEIREITTDHPALAATPIGEAELAYRRRIGALGFGAFQGGQLIGYIWFSLTSYDEREIRLRFVPAPQGRTSWDFDVYFRPEHRVGFGFAKLWDAANAALTARGVTWSVSRISAFNPHSMASHKRLGAVVVRKVVTFRAGRWRLHVATRPYEFRLSSAGGAWPELRVSAPRTSAR